MQHKAHLSYNNVDMCKQYNNLAKIEKKSTHVTLQEGDILYHPAGIWHAVSSTEDSIAINFSMKTMRMGEFVTQAIQGCLYQHLNQRKFLRFESQNDLETQLKEAFKQASKLCL